MTRVILIKKYADQRFILFLFLFGAIDRTSFSPFVINENESIHLLYVDLSDARRLLCSNGQ